MKLSLDLLGPPRLMGARQHCELRSGSLAIGRSPEADWVIPDTDRLISRQHLRIDASYGEFVLTDTSANGVFVNGSDEPVGHGASCRLQDGDRLRIGEAQIAVAIEAAAAQPDALGDSFAAALRSPAQMPSGAPRDPFGGPFEPPPGRAAGQFPAPSQPSLIQPNLAHPTTATPTIDANWMNHPLPGAPPDPRQERAAPVVLPLRAAGQAAPLRAVPEAPSLLALIEKHPDVPIRRLAQAVDDVGQTLNASTWQALYEKIKHLMDIKDL